MAFDNVSGLNQHLGSGRSRRRGHHPSKVLQSPLQTKPLDSSHFWDSWCSVFTRPFSYTFQFKFMAMSLGGCGVTTFTFFCHLERADLGFYVCLNCVQQYSSRLKRF